MSLAYSLAYRLPDRILVNFGRDLTLNLRGQILNLFYLSQKWYDCYKTTSKHIDWALGVKWDHQAWPWPRPWPWLSKAKYWICYILWQMTQLLQNDLGYDLGLGFSRTNFQIALTMDFQGEFWNSCVSGMGRLMWLRRHTINPGPYIIMCGPHINDWGHQLSSGGPI